MQKTIEEYKESLKTVKAVMSSGREKNIGEAIVLLKKLNEIAKLTFEHDLIGLSGRHRRNERNFHIKAISTSADYKLDREKIKHALLTLMDDMLIRIEEQAANAQDIEENFNLQSTAKKPLVLIIYANNPTDSVFAQELRAHLMPLESITNEIRVEDINDSPFGVNVTTWRKQKIEESALTLCLITPSFFVSKDKLFALAKAANDKEKAIVPVLIKSTPFYEKTFLVHLTPLPINREFIAKWPDRDFAYTEIVEMVHSHVQRWEG